MSPRILVVHNYYKHRGGEDKVFELEVELLRRNGVSVETLTFTNNDLQSNWDKLKIGISGLYNTDAAHQLKTKIAEFNPALIHVHNFFPIASPAIFNTARQLRIPIIVTLHNFRLICPNALLYRDNQPCEACVNKTFPWEGVLHACYRNSHLQSGAVALMSTLHKIKKTWQNDIDFYITLNAFARHKILTSTLGIKPEQITIKPNFTFNAYLPNEPMSPPEKRDNFFLYIGRLSHEKGIDILLNAFKTVPYRLKIIGTGPLEDQVQKMSIECEQIEYLGFKEHSEIIALLKQARALIVPSTCYENFPMTILEAFSAGTPVICSRIGGLPDIVKDDFNGLLVEPSSASSLIESLNSMKDDVDYNQLCVNARETYLKYYTPEENFRQLMAIYQKVINRKNAQ